MILKLQLNGMGGIGWSETMVGEGGEQLVCGKHPEAPARGGI